MPHTILGAGIQNRQQPPPPPMKNTFQWRGPQSKIRINRHINYIVSVLENCYEKNNTAGDRGAGVGRQTAVVTRAIRKQGTWEKGVERGSQVCTSGEEHSSRWTARCKDPTMEAHPGCLRNRGHRPCSGRGRSQGERWVRGRPCRCSRALMRLYPLL